MVDKNTNELIEIYEKIVDFIKFLDKETTKNKE